MKTLGLCLLLSFVPLFAHTKSVDPENMLRSHACSAQIFEKLANWTHKPTLIWRQSPSDSYSRKNFLSSLGKTGWWVEFSLDEVTSSLSLRQIRPEGSTRISFETTNCFAKNLVEKPESWSDQREAVKEFSDLDLDQLLQAKKKALIYIWSPRMPYSVTDFKRYKKMSQALGLEFVSLLAPNVSESEARAALRTQKLEFSGRRMASIELQMRNGTLHFPSMFVVSNGKIHPNRLIGILKQDDFLGSVRSALKELAL